MKKILFMYDYMHSLGGVQKVISLLSANAEKIDSSIDLLSKRSEREFRYPFFGRVVVVDLARKASFLRRVVRFIRLFLLLRKYDVIVDFRPKKQRDFVVDMMRTFGFLERTFHCVSSSNITAYLGDDLTWANQYLSHSRGVVCLTDEMADAIRSVYDIHNVFVVPNPVSAEEVEAKMQESLPDHLPQQYVLASGRLHWVKGFDLLLRAYKGSVAERLGLKVVILGDGDEREALIALADFLGVSESVIFEGFVSNPFKYSARARFFVLSSRSEGFGNVLIENLYAGVPVIAYDCVSGPRTIVCEGFNGLLVPLFDREEAANYFFNKIVHEEDVMSLRRAMDVMMVDADAYARMKLFARSSAEKFNVDGVVLKWKALFDE